MLNSIVTFEGAILTYVQTQIRCAPLDIFMKIVTTLGDAGIIWILACVAMLIFKKSRCAGVAAAISLIIEAICVNGLLKNLIMRDRPFNVIEGLSILIETPHDYSFPSGHAGSSFAVAMVILLILPRRWGIPAIITAVVMAMSRIYVGVHFPSDILAGAVIGTATAILSVYIVKLPKVKKLICGQETIADDNT